MRGPLGALPGVAAQTLMVFGIMWDAYRFLRPSPDLLNCNFVFVTVSPCDSKARPGLETAALSYSQSQCPENK